MLCVLRCHSCGEPTPNASSSLPLLDVRRIPSLL